MNHKVSSYFVVVVLLASATLNVALSRELRASRSSAAPPTIVGVSVPSIRGTTPDGRQLTVAYDVAQPTLLYYFSAECGWCNRNEANVKVLLDRARASHRIVAISSTALGRQHPSGLPADAIVLADVAQTTLDTYQLVGTPHTLVISPDGRVVKSWAGAYRKASADDVSRFFGVQLPGLTVAASTR